MAKGRLRRQPTFESWPPHKDISFSWVLELSPPLLCLSLIWTVQPPRSAGKEVGPPKKKKEGNISTPIVSWEHEMLHKGHSEVRKTGVAMELTWRLSVVNP
jgi:hypothetical protein